MVRFSVSLSMVLLLVGCASSSVNHPVPEIKTQIVNVPVMSCPIFDTSTIFANEPIKEGGLEYITSSTSHGEVAKHWIYEVNYWKRLYDINKRAFEEMKIEYKRHKTVNVQEWSQDENNSEIKIGK